MKSPRIAQAKHVAASAAAGGGGGGLVQRKMVEAEASRRGFAHRTVRRQAKAEGQESVAEEGQVMTRAWTAPRLRQPSTESIGSRRS